jgi:hypothetical protein
MPDPLPELGRLPSVSSHSTTKPSPLSSRALAAASVRGTFPGQSRGFYRSYLAPELERHASGYADYLRSASYRFLRESSSAGYYETVESLERSTVKAVRRATRDWLLEETGIDSWAAGVRTETLSVDRIGERLSSRTSGSPTEIRLVFSGLLPRIVIDRATSSGDFRFRASLDGRAGFDFRPLSRRAPWLATDLDLRRGTANLSLGMAF